RMHTQRQVMQNIRAILVMESNIAELNIAPRGLRKCSRVRRICDLGTGIQNTEQANRRPACLLEACINTRKRSDRANSNKHINRQRKELPGGDVTIEQFHTAEPHDAAKRRKSD